MTMNSNFIIRRSCLELKTRLSWKCETSSSVYVHVDSAFYGGINQLRWSTACGIGAEWRPHSMGNNLAIMTKYTDQASHCPRLAFLWKSAAMLAGHWRYWCGCQDRFSKREACKGQLSTENARDLALKMLCAVSHNEFRSHCGHCTYWWGLLSVWLWLSNYAVGSWWWCLYA